MIVSVHFVTPNERVGLFHHDNGWKRYTVCFDIALQRLEHNASNDCCNNMDDLGWNK